MSRSKAGEQPTRTANEGEGGVSRVEGKELQWI